MRADVWGSVFKKKKKKKKKKKFIGFEKESVQEDIHIRTLEKLLHIGSSYSSSLM